MPLFHLVLWHAGLPTAPQSLRFPLQRLASVAVLRDQFLDLLRGDAGLGGEILDFIILIGRDAVPIAEVRLRFVVGHLLCSWLNDQPQRAAAAFCCSGARISETVTWENGPQSQEV